jgi:peptide deformylase
MKDGIVQAGAPVLRLTATPVAARAIGSARLTELIEHMRALLAEEEYGVALAAPQVGESLRLFIVAGRVFAEDESPAPPDKVFINPQLTRLSKKMKEMSEGCLSVRGQYGTVMRHEKATVKALDEDGKPFSCHGAGLLAHIFQHECDHLDGILYIDKAVKLEADDDLAGARKKLKEKHAI